MTDETFWDKEIGVEEINGVSFRMYSKRPRRIVEFLRFAEYWEDRPYVIQGDRVLTFRGMLNGSAAKARLLKGEGVTAGDRVFILGWNSPDWVMNFWACVRIGAVPVLANTWWSADDLADALGLLQPVVTLADKAAATKVPQEYRLVSWKADENAAGGEEPFLDADARNENDPAAIIFTSGTQGRAKAVVLAHRSLLANQLMILHVTRKLPYHVVPTSGDAALHTGPLFHIGGIQAQLRGVLVGNTMVMTRGKFDPGELLELIEKHKIVRWSAVPTMMTRVLEHPDLKRRNVSSLRAMTLGGSVVHPDLLARVRAGLPSVEARIATGYGLSENGGQATTASGSDTTARPGSAGRAMPLVEIRFLSNAELADGEILVRSPTQMLGYFGDESSPIDSDGWLLTGDLGQMDEDGHIWITGRSKEIIIRGGENIAPAAVERALESIADVVEAAVFGVPHPDLGEEVMAVVVVASDMTELELADQVRGTLPSFAVPSRWKLQTDPLPVNQTGKVDKTGLARIATQDLGEDPERKTA